jgi:hypothetical protein
VERLEVEVKVRGINEHKLFKIDKLNLQGRSKDWYKKLATTLVDWSVMKVAMLLKYGTMDKEEIWAKLDQIKQEPKQSVHVYLNRMEKKFTKRKLEDVKVEGSYLSYTLKSESCVS